MTLDATQTLERLIPQYGGTKTEDLLRALLELTQDQISAPVNALARDFDDLVGYQLDEVGARMGFARPQLLDSTLVYWGFADEDVGFNRGAMATADPVHFPGVPLGDDLYRPMLRARGVALRGTGSRADISEALRHLSYEGEVRVADVAQMSVRSIPHVLNGMTAYQTSSHQAIVATGYDGVATVAFYRIDHVTGELHRLDVGNWDEVNLAWSGFGVNGRRALLTEISGAVADIGTAWGADITAPLINAQTTLSGDRPLDIRASISGASGPIQPSGQLFFGSGGDQSVGFACTYLDANDLRQCAWAEKNINAPPTIHQETLLIHRTPEGAPSYDDRFVVTGVTHDYASSWGRINSDGSTPGTIYLMSRDGEVIRQDDVSAPSDMGESHDQFIHLGTHPAVPADAIFESIVYHDGDFYGSWDSASGGPALFAYALGGEDAPAAFEAHMYHPNLHYRNLVAAYIDELISRPAGVKLTLHTHAVP